jgi:triosephosphate isomerase (TIM)
MHTQKSYIFVGNWKMFLSHNHAKKWLTQHITTLHALSAHNNLIICPSFDILAYAAQIRNETTSQNSHLALGAQDCAAYDTGPHTGQISAQSLAEIGCTYAIIGHSEQRTYFDHEELSAKIAQLATHEITPIVCVQNATIDELAPIIHAYDQGVTTNLLIAYEPIDAIGTNNVPTNEHIQSTLEEIAKILQKRCVSLKFTLLYGGSVSPTTITRLKRIALLQGFLLGRVSIDIDALTTIIEMTSLI